MRLFRSKPKVGGQIAYYELEDWWFSELSDIERDTIEQRVGRTSVGESQTSTRTVVNFLNGLASWFDGNANQRLIGRRLAVKAASYKKAPVLDRHFAYLSVIKTHYPDRGTVPGAFETAVQACEGQIGIAGEASKAFKKDPWFDRLPRHTGYEQLAIIREKEKDFNEAIRLSKAAKEQGWAGDWDKRIARCETKIR